MRESVRLVCLATLLLLAAPASAGARGEARDVLNKIGTKRGLCAVLDDPNCELALELARASELTVYVQLPSHGDLKAARRAAHAAGLYGTRIYVEKGELKRLYLADNLADAVVARKAGGVPRAEILRVLHPGGKALLGKTEIIKPFPGSVDEWSHPYHGPDNNPLSNDRVARAPYLTHFLAEPWYVPMPEVTVASAGRLFTAFGFMTSKRREQPWLNTLVAINGYNGTILWKRRLKPGFMMHRNTMIATPKVLYLGDDTSCKLIDAATGELKGEIVPPRSASTGPVWKWMALEDGVLYALLGGEEWLEPAIRGRSTGHGWWWGGIGKGYGGRDPDPKKYPWGFGRAILAIDPGTKKVLWSHKETEPIDGRAVCMESGRIYFYSHTNFLGCLDARTGRELWRITDGSLFEAIGPHTRAQSPATGFASCVYLKCTDKALYFAGPQRSRLVAISTDGKPLWTYQEGNYQLVLRKDAIYAMGRHSKKLDLTTGRVLGNLPHRGGCTRPTGSIDSIFVRGGGTVRYGLAAGRARRISPMRPACEDGVIIAGGLLYWTPWMCDCNLSLLGFVCLEPAGGFNFSAKAVESERLEGPAGGARKVAVAKLRESPNDWPTYRANNVRSAGTEVAVPEKPSLLWEFKPLSANVATAPVAAGGMVFVGGSDGVVRALDASSGKRRWTAYTGGPVYFPPSIWKGRACVGSGDGWIYSLEAATGRLLWRFRAAPVERRIPVYGSLSSNWPVASGVLVENGVAYAAAGIANFDGTHVYALDALTGRIRWQNNTSGVLNKDIGTGVSVQGCLLLYQGKLCLAGGNVVSPAVYDAVNGKCFNTVRSLGQSADGNKGPDMHRGRDLFLVGQKVVSAGNILYSPPNDHYTPFSYARNTLSAFSGGVVIQESFLRNRQLMRLESPVAPKQKPKPVWQTKVHVKSMGLAVARNAVLAIGVRTEGGKPQKEGVRAGKSGKPATFDLAALSPDGKVLWREPLKPSASPHSAPAAPVPWGLAVDSSGRIVVSLRDGRVLCFGRKR